MMRRASTARAARAVAAAVALFCVAAQCVAEVADGGRVDASSIERRVLIGYQGWFDTPNDGALQGWKHWAHGSDPPSASDATFDLVPDTSEYVQDELQATGMVLNNGAPFKVFSAQLPSTVDVHFSWMRQYGLDGVWLQRFLTDIASPTGKNARDAVLRNVRQSAERHGRCFSVMYDVSGAPDSTLVEEIQRDWWELLHSNVTESAAYLHEGGKPVVAVWGLGFEGNPGDHDTSYNIVNWMQLNGAYVVGGVPFHWRTGTGDSKAGFEDVYAKFDGVVPWSVGRYDSVAAYDSARAAVQLPDVAAALGRGQSYAPVIWPGFSWANLQRDPSLFDSIPRQGGKFFEAQISGAISLAPSWIFVAMFDEVNESTAIFKAANSTAYVPSQGQWLYLEEGSDHYLKLTQLATEKLRAR